MPEAVDMDDGARSMQLLSVTARNRMEMEMVKRSAGILLFRKRPSGLEVLLAHPGGPFWIRRNEGAWTIPKGEIKPGEYPLDAAKREFEEETGFVVTGTLLPLQSIQQRSGKIVNVWAVEQDVDPAVLNSNTFTMEWPPRSGRQEEFPEIDRAQWFAFAEARTKILPSQMDLLDQLEQLLGIGGGTATEETS